MSSISDSIAGLFSASGLIAFAGGVAATRGYYWVKCQMWNRHHPDDLRSIGFRSLYILWSLIFIFITYVGVQQNQTSHRVEALSENTARCQREFLQQLKFKTEAGEDTDKWSAIKTKALSDWMHELLMPPADIASRRLADPKDPIVFQWSLSVTAHYDGIIQEAQEQQEAALQARMAHPLPEATCGK